MLINIYCKFCVELTDGKTAKYRSSAVHAICSLLHALFLSSISSMHAVLYMCVYSVISCAPPAVESLLYTYAFNI